MAGPLTAQMQHQCALGQGDGLGLLLEVTITSNRKVTSDRATDNQESSVRLVVQDVVVIGEEEEQRMFDYNIGQFNGDKVKEIFRKAVNI